MVGPKRSGTSVHIDPLGTSAWNTVIRGRKLWVVFPPSVEKRVAKAKDMFKDEDDEPVRGESTLVHANSSPPMVDSCHKFPGL